MTGRAEKRSSAGTSRATEDLLSEVELFSALTRRQLREVIARAREVDHEVGREIAHEGLGGLAFHLVLAGEVAVDVHGAREAGRLHPGDYFGEITMIDGKPRSATVTVTEPTRTLAIPHQVFEELVMEEPEFAKVLLKQLCARVRRAEAAG